VDTREQDLHVLRDLERNGVKCIRKKLDFGDYTFEADGKSYERQIVIERKGSLDELIGNLTSDKARFEREFKRARGTKVILMVEAGPDQIDSGRYRSKIRPADLKRRLDTWCHTFQLELIYTEPNQSWAIMLDRFRAFYKAHKE